MSVDLVIISGKRGGMADCVSGYPDVLTISDYILSKKKEKEKKRPFFVPPKIIL